MTEAASMNETSESQDSPAPICEARPRCWHLIVAALIGTGLAWPFLMHFENAFPMENLSVEMTNRIRAKADDPIAWAKERQNRWESWSRNAILNLGIFGICVGSCLGLAAALHRGGTILTTLQTFAYGAGLGLVGGAAGGYFAAAMAIFVQGEKGMDVSVRSLLIHASGWVVPGLACGVILALATGQRRWTLQTLGGLLGGLTAAVVYEPLAALLFQLNRTDIPVPDGSGNKFLFLVLAAVLMTTGAWKAGVSPVVRKVSPRG